MQLHKISEIYVSSRHDNGKNHALIMIIKVNPNNLLEKEYYVCNLNDWKCCPHYIHDSFKQNKIYLKHFLCKSFEEWIYRLKNKGEIITASWNRTVDFWFDINKEFRYKKDEIISLYVTDDFEIKKNDYKI